MSYLSFEDYQNMGGAITDENDFNDIAFEAGSLIDWYTFNRLQKEAYEDIPEAVKRCMYHLIKLIELERAAYAVHNQNGSGGSDLQEASIASQSNDGVSVSYNVMSASTAANNIKDKIDGDVKRYLNGVMNSLGRKLLYRGLYPGE